MEFKKKTIIWESNNEPPKNYIWVHDGKEFEFQSSTNQWEESSYGIVNLKPKDGIKRVMVFESNSLPPDNYIWNKNGEILVCNNNEWKTVSNAGSETTNNDNVKKYSFGGIEVSQGPLYYTRGRFIVADSWDVNSFGKAYGITQGSTYFSWDNLVRIFGGDENTITNSKTINGWRIPTPEEIRILLNYEQVFDTNSNSYPYQIGKYRTGSTVNGQTVSFVRVVLPEGSFPGGGALIFPDGETYSDIPGYFDMWTYNDPYWGCNINLVALKYLTDNGCVFFPSAGDFAIYSYATGWNGWSNMEYVTTSNNTRLDLVTMVAMNYSFPAKVNENRYNEVKLVRSIE